MRFLILGRLQIDDESGQYYHLRAPKRRALLTSLLLQPGRFVSMDRLQEFLWNDPPPSATANIRSHFTGLRADLDRAEPGLHERLCTSRGGGGYRLLVPAHDIDLQGFTRAACQGRSALLKGDVTAAVDALETGLALWRGPFGDGLLETRRVAAHAAGLNHARLDACQDLYTAYILNDGAGLLTYRIEGAIADAPYRERLWELLMAAHYHNGDVASALSTVSRCRTMFGDDLGLDLPPGVHAMQSAILDRDGNKVRQLVQLSTGRGWE